METPRTTLWCKLLGRLVEVELAQDRTAGPCGPGIPEGWRVRACLEKDTVCYGTGCPFTTDSLESPFGEIGELLEGPPERFDPFAGPAFESEWG